MVNCLRQSLAPAVWKQAQHGLPPTRKRSDARWTFPFPNLVLVLAAMTWALGDSVSERFPMARGITSICRPKRRRPGRTPEGFQKALSRLPAPPACSPW